MGDDVKNRTIVGLLLVCCAGAQFSSYCRGFANGLTDRRFRVLEPYDTRRTRPSECATFFYSFARVRDPHNALRFSGAR
jgi:hypothetical protein